MAKRIIAMWNGLTLKPENIDWTNKDLSGLLDHADDGLEVMISKFDTIEDVDKFIEKFPKFVKIRRYQVVGGEKDYFSAGFSTIIKNKQTGIHNELGVKRTKKLIDVLKTLK